MSRRTFETGSLAAAFLFLGIAAGLATVGEVAAIVPPGAPPSDKFEYLVDRGLRPALSEYSKRTVLDACVDTVGSLYSLVQPTDRLATLLDTCGQIAHATIAEVPVHALAWVVAADVAAQRRNVAEVLADLVESHRAAPNELWLAYMRTELMSLYEVELTPEAEAAYNADLALLATSQRGVQLMARRYATDRAFRERVVEIVEQLSAEDQQGFVSRLTAAVRRAAGT